ncbi:MAG: dienelactone hydrolase family protein [Flavobacteriales bacterium]|nr:dienelactone hydrolase family protein [Flavobacteriales bacterium]
MIKIVLIILLSINFSLFGQGSKVLKMYKHHSVVVKHDTINYHTYAKKGIDSLNSILLYIQGSSAMSLYQVKKEDGKIMIGTTVPFNFKTIPDDYLFVVISRKGFPFSTKMDDDIPIPEAYFQNQTLDYRVFQADRVLNDLTKKHKKQFKNIIALGHSEGSDVIAKLGTINNDVTHFGYWSGGGNTQFMDFVTFIRKDVDSGKISEEQAQLQIDSLFTDFKDIMANPNAIDKFWQGEDNSYKRWSHFSEPPIDNLLKISKPIFVAIGTKDQAVTLESAYLIPIEFIRQRKDNLTFKAYPYLNHGFRFKLENGNYKSHWNDVFNDFLNWVEKEQPALKRCSKRR